ncbi:hypothetical protein [Mycolicibacterium sp.]|uniref:hypothetical protein n=1 Tax=Mycolicibacterium sp. TaxID=2320850 RepID=UPI0037CA904B
MFALLGCFTLCGLSGKPTLFEYWGKLGDALIVIAAAGGECGGAGYKDCRDSQNGALHLLSCQSIFNGS